MSLVHGVEVVNASNVLPKIKEAGYMLADLSKSTGLSIEDLVKPNGLIYFYAEQKNILDRMAK